MNGHGLFIGDHFEFAIRLLGHHATHSRITDKKEALAVLKVVLVDKCGQIKFMLLGHCLGFSYQIAYRQNLPGS